MRSNVEFEEKLTLGSKNGMMNLVNCNVGSDKSENLHFDVLLFSKIYYVWAKKNTEELFLTTLKNDAKFEEELTCVLKNDMRNLGIVDPTVESLKNFKLMGSFWQKYIMFELKKIQKRYV